MAQSSDPLAAALVIRVAQPTDIAQVISILQEAAQWLIGRDIHQWTPDDFTPPDVQRWIDTGVVLLAWRGAAAIGTVSVALSADDVWQQIPTASAGYVHKLAVRRGAAGQGVSGQLLQAAEAYLRRQVRAQARLDCWAGNDALRRFYTAAGYTLCGIVDEQDWQCALFEKTL